MNNRLQSLLLDWCTYERNYNDPTDALDVIGLIKGIRSDTLYEFSVYLLSSR